MTCRPRVPLTRLLVPAILLAAFAPVSDAQPPAPPLATTAAASAIPELSAAGSVTLPYAELRALWLAAQAKTASANPAAPQPPPVRVSLQSARYALELTGADGNRQARVGATFEVLALAPEGWTALPLLPAGAGARLTGVEPADALLTVRDGFFTLLLDRPGRHVITLRFDAPLTTLSPAADRNVPPTATLQLALPPALVNELTVGEAPAGFLLEANGAAASPGVPVHLAAGQALALALVRAEDRRPAPPPAPSRWRAEAQSLVRFDEGRLLYKTRLRADAESGAGLALNLRLPTAANVLSVEGPDLERWRVSRTEDGRRVEISWKTPDTLRREFVVAYEMPQTAPEGDWSLVAPALAPEPAEGGGTLTGARFILPKVPGLEFTDPTVDNAAAPAPVTDPRTLPRWLAESIGGEDFLTVSGSGIRVRRLPLVRTAAATVEEARFRTRLVADGATLTEGTLTVRHDAPLAFTLTLPENTQLLTCAVDGRDLAPVDRGNGRIELALPARSGGSGNPTATTRVAFSYAGRERPLAPVSGRAALTLPLVDTFIQALWWDLQIPDAYAVEDLDGNVHRDESAAAAATPAGAAVPLHLRKELVRAERPAVELFYQKRAVAP